jgi:hypothetical protein
MSFVVSTVVVRHGDDVVLLSEDGAEIDDIGTAAEEARLTRLELEHNRPGVDGQRQADASGRQCSSDGLVDLQGLSPPLHNHVAQAGR